MNVVKGQALLALSQAAPYICGEKGDTEGQAVLRKTLRVRRHLCNQVLRLSADFSKETLQARRGWTEVFEVMKGKDLHPRLLYPAQLSFRMEGQIKCFPDKVKLKELIITQPLLYEMLKELIEEKEEDKKYKQ